MIHAHFGQLLAGNFSRLIALHTLHMQQRFHHILFDSQMRPQVKALKHHSHPLADFRQIAMRHRLTRAVIHADTLPTNVNFPAVRLFKPVHTAQQRRFSRA